MINSSNNVSFKGMSASEIIKFVPTIANKNAINLAKLLDNQIPNDILVVAGKNEIHHMMKLGEEYTVMNKFKYEGLDEEISRVNFLGKIASKIANGFNSNK